MATRKFIYWRPDAPSNEKGETYANIHLLTGDNQPSISNFIKMGDELRETFPQATNDEICGGKVFKSSLVDGYTIITWNAYIPQGEYPDWKQVKHGNMAYRW